MRAFARQVWRSGGSEEFAFVTLCQRTPEQEAAVRGKRGGKVRESLPKQRSLNNRRSVQTFVELAQVNFGENDFSLDLSFSDKYLPTCVEDEDRLLRRYIARLRRVYKSAGVEFKYMAVISDTSVEGEVKRLHVHLLCSGGVDPWVVRKKWGYGIANVDLLEPQEDGIAGKAAYMARQTGTRVREGRVTKKRWRCSNNLTRLWSRNNDSKYSIGKLRRMAASPPSAAEWADIYPGYSVVSFDVSACGGGDSFPQSIYLTLRRNE